MSGVADKPACLPWLPEINTRRRRRRRGIGQGAYVALFVNDRGRESLGLDLAFCHSRPARMDNMLHEGGWRGGKGLAWRDSSVFLLVFQKFRTHLVDYDLRDSLSKTICPMCVPCTPRSNYLCLKSTSGETDVIRRDQRHD